jgi:diguanylate cyclase (GGDEF)-like protein
VRSVHTWAFAGRPRRLRVLITTCVLAALVLPLAVGAAQVDGIRADGALTAGALVALSVINVEIGRILDGGLEHSHRPHKALSAWAFAAALLLPAWWLVPVVATTYAHARWRGLRLQLWKWVGSAAYVTLAALAAQATATAVGGSGTGEFSSGPGALLAVSSAAAVFLLVETALFHGSAYLNDADDEVWLRRILRGPSFYTTEAAVLLVGGLSAAVLALNPWLLPLLLPAYGLAQQAALNEPLQQQARTDPKTGLYRYESWRSQALAAQERCTARRRPWSVVFADIDQFKPYNDTWGHLAGDAALVAVADLLRGALRSHDMVGRFGGEEFCLFLPDTASAEAAEVAGRLRAAVEALPLPDTQAHITMSLGVVSADSGEGELLDAVRHADKALYVAKERGRNAVHLLRLQPETPGPEAPAASRRRTRPESPGRSSAA